MVDKECNLRAGVYKVQTFGTTQSERRTETASYEFLKLRDAVRGVSTDRRHTLRAQ
jgi:hypothetical protein